MYTASGIVTLYKWTWWPCSTSCTAWPPRPLTQSDDTKCWIYTIWPPEDEHIIARNTYRNVILCK